MGQVDLQKMMQAKAQAGAMLEAEVRGVAKEIYVALVVPYLTAYLERQGLPDSSFIDPTVKYESCAPSLKKLADLAVKSAPYLHQAAGLVSVDDQQLWGGKS